MLKVKVCGWPNTASIKHCMQDVSQTNDSTNGASDKSTMPIYCEWEDNSEFLIRCTDS